MNYLLLLIENINFLSVKSILLDMTINNPIFIFAVITVIWFIPGILVRRINELKLKKKKEKSQSEAIKRLYPNSKEFLD